MQEDLLFLVFVVLSLERVNRKEKILHTKKYKTSQKV